MYKKTKKANEELEEDDFSGLCIIWRKAFRLVIPRENWENA